MTKASLLASIVTAALLLAPSATVSQSTSKVPDFSGMWTVQGRQQYGSRGSNKPDSVPMTAWAEEKYKLAHPPFGENETFSKTTDPVQKYCDPPGLTRLYNYPWQFTILQTPKTVYILFEFSRVWRSVAMDRDHPKDPDSTWMGDSVGRYEGDTLVIDTVGFNEKTWLDNAGHPHSDKLHVVERFRRADANTLELALTIDDPKAYSKTFTENLRFNASKFPMGETLCSLSELQEFQKKVIEPTNTPQNAK